MTTAVDRDVWVFARGGLTYHTRKRCQRRGGTAMRVSEIDAVAAGRELCQRCERVAPRQARVVELAGAGMTYAAIAARLNLEGWPEASEYTVGNDLRAVWSEDA